jgi:hypothetical protein
VRIAIVGPIAGVDAVFLHAYCAPRICGIVAVAISGNEVLMASASKTMRVLVVVVLVAAVAVVAASIVVIKQSNRIAKIERRVGSGSVEQVAFEADREARNLHFSLASENRTMRVDGVLAPNREGFLLGGNLQEAPSGMVYQLWADTSTGPISLGVLGDDATKASAFRLPVNATRLFITPEAADGAKQPAMWIVEGAVPVRF